MTKQQLEQMDEQQAIAATTGMTEHPEGYEGPCGCGLCMTYGEPDEG